jgi:hypothetical protein
MAPLLNPKLYWLLVFGGVLYAGQSERVRAMQWADYYAALYSVPPDLVQAIIEVESAWQPRAVSKKGAVGLMQLMPSTAANFGVTNRFEIEQNIRGGVAYLARLLKLFNGDLRLVAAAYVAGEERILPVGLRYSNAEVFEYLFALVIWSFTRVAGGHRWDRWVVAVVALLFAVVHLTQPGVSWLQIACITSTGTLYGWIRYVSGSVAPAAAAHTAYNLTLYAMAGFAVDLAKAVAG